MRSMRKIGSTAPPRLNSLDVLRMRPTGAGNTPPDRHQLTTSVLRSCTRRSRFTERWRKGLSRAWLSHQAMRLPTIKSTKALERVSTEHAPRSRSARVERPTTKHLCQPLDECNCVVWCVQLNHSRTRRFHDPFDCRCAAGSVSDLRSENSPGC